MLVALTVGMRSSRVGAPLVCARGAKTTIAITGAHAMAAETIRRFMSPSESFKPCRATVYCLCDSLHGAPPHTPAPRFAGALGPAPLRRSALPRVTPAARFAAAATRCRRFSIVLRCPRLPDDTGVGNRIVLVLNWFDDVRQR